MNHSQFVVRAGAKVRLKKYDPGFTGNFDGEQGAEASSAEDAAELAKYQDILLAHETYAVLTLFQGMDGAGKDGTIKHVMSSADPQGCKVAMFKKPSEKEYKQVYLSRYVEALPEKGQIGIFNRSYYEHVVAERVHPEKLDEWKQPADTKGKGIWERRYREINNFEQYLVDNGVHILKFFLHLSKEKQAERLLERTELPEKKWKFSSNDMQERGHWDENMKVYEDVLSNTSTKAAPWHVIPADNRWFTCAAVSSVIISTLKSLHSRYPTMSKERREEMAKTQKILERERKAAR
ncbi:MAG: polyphosphate kinase 2 family protein [Rubrivivax sp.]|nr:polyphosphate kinase 2 family protein [Pyrinomonadaceae bacterium]